MKMRVSKWTRIRDGALFWKFSEEKPQLILQLSFITSDRVSIFSNIRENVFQEYPEL